jgi:hypothetical protein
MIGTLRGELVGQSAEPLSVMASALASSFSPSGLEAPEFAAALDIIEIGDLAALVIRRRPSMARAIRPSSIAAITAPSSFCSIRRPACRRSSGRAIST